MVPERIDETSDLILDEIIECEKTGRAFKIMPQELAFYLENKIC
jgi:hypothetical protein